MKRSDENEHDKNEKFGNRSYFSMLDDVIYMKLKSTILRTSMELLIYYIEHVRAQIIKHRILYHSSRAFHEYDMRDRSSYYR